MKEILMMMLPGCPHCMRANTLIQELQEENEKYRAVIINRVDESVDTALAESLDYYYVPCFFIDGRKIMEGVPSKESIKAVLEAAITE